MKIPFLRRQQILAFTLVELLVVVAIIALLVSVSLPNIRYSILKAQSVKCASQLHGIGIAVLADATDNNSTFPQIDQASTNVYLPAGSVPGLVGVLGHYGVTTNDIQCPVDMSMGGSSSFAQYGSSYEWDPVLDDGSDPPTTVGWEGQPVTVNADRLRLLTDFNPIHNGKVNALYADGHVRAR